MIQESALGQGQSQRLLETYTDWLFNQPYSKNPGEDKKGNLIESLNAQNSVWILPGYFNTILKGAKRDGSPKIQRNIKIPEGKSLFLIVASSHATKHEVDKPTESALVARALETDDLWRDVKLTIDRCPYPLVTEMTGAFEVDIPGPDNGKDHPYIKYLRELVPSAVPGKTPVVTIARVASLGPLKMRNVPYVIDFYGRHDGAEWLKEVPYEVSLRYNITIHQEITTG